MRSGEVEVGAEYLTRGVQISGLFGPTTTRGSVRIVEKRPSGRFLVEWLMADGSIRRDTRLPLIMAARSLLVKVEPVRSG